jgi:hypothetical protein
MAGAITMQTAASKSVVNLVFRFFISLNFLSSAGLSVHKAILKHVLHRIGSQILGG